MLRPRHLSHQLLFSGDSGDYDTLPDLSASDSHYRGTGDTVRYNNYRGRRHNYHRRHQRHRDSYAPWSDMSLHHSYTARQDMRITRNESIMRVGQWRSPAIVDEFVQVLHF